MKLDQEELELIALRHLTTSAKAVDRMLACNITADHFQFVQEGSKVSHHSKLFGLLRDYYEKSGGSLMTQLVLENRLIEEQVKDKSRGKYITLWAKLEEIDVDENDLYEIITQLKDRYCMKLMNEMFKDAHEYLIDKGIEECLSMCQERLETIRDMKSEFIVDKQSLDISEAAPYFKEEFEKRANHPDKFRGIPCGLPQIDDVTLGWMPGQLIVLLAPSSGGKSIQMLNWALYANQVYGKKILYFSFEMSLWLCLLRHLSLMYEVPYRDLKSTPKDDYRIINMIEKMCNDTSPYFEYDVNMEDPTPEYIDSRIKELIATKGMPDMVVVDYIGNMTTRTSRRDAKPWEKQGDAVEKLFALAKRYQIPFLTAQQVNREAIKESRQRKENGKASGFFQDAASGDQRLIHLAHFVIGVEPDKQFGRNIYHPVKMRDAMFDPFAARVDPVYNRIYPIPEEDQPEHLRRESATSSSSSDNRVKKVHNTVEEDTSMDDLILHLPSDDEINEIDEDNWT